MTAVKMAAGMFYIDYGGLNTTMMVSTQNNPRNNAISQ